MLHLMHLLYNNLNLCTNTLEEASKTEISMLATTNTSKELRADLRRKEFRMSPK